MKKLFYIVYFNFFPVAYSNKIIIVGNGFDLAHGYKTAFCDFADYLIDVKIAPQILDYARYREKKGFLSDKFCETLMKRFNNFGVGDHYSFLMQFSYDEQNHVKAGPYLKKNTDFLKEVLNNKLLGELYKKTDGSWFDIEQKYFNKLKGLKNRIGNPQLPFRLKDLTDLNSEFNEIKNLFTEYLKTVETFTEENINEFLLRLIYDYDRIYIINFNYTNSVRRYVEESQRITINHIHGNLVAGEIIFGYGNDQDNDYQQIKNTGIDEFLRFFKTFEYMDSDNYERIHREAIDLFDKYDVDVIGHSLGQTDKTLLSEILNNEKCTSINFYKRKDLNDHSVKESFKQLQYAASRIITNEAILRRKVVNFNNSKSFP